MSAATDTADRPQDPPSRDTAARDRSPPATPRPDTARDARPTRDPGGLIALVRALTTFGRGLLVTLRSRNQSAPPFDAACRFGTLNLALILARLTRGIMIAQALEARLLRRRPRIAPPAPRPIPATPAPARPRRPRARQPDEAAELLGRLPTAEEIAARIRRRAIGAVFVDICRDLGIDTQHPLWRDISQAITRNGGNMVKLLLLWADRLPALEEITRQPQTAPPDDASPADPRLVDPLLAETPMPRPPAPDPRVPDPPWHAPPWPAAPAPALALPP